MHLERQFYTEIVYLGFPGSQNITPSEYLWISMTITVTAVSSELSQDTSTYRSGYTQCLGKNLEKIILRAGFEPATYGYPSPLQSTALPTELSKETLPMHPEQSFVLTFVMILPSSYASIKDSLVV